MSKITSNTQIDTINILTEVNSANDTDLILLQRGLVSHKMKKQNLTLDDNKVISNISGSSLSSASTAHEAFELINLKFEGVLNKVEEGLSDIPKKCVLEHRASANVSGSSNWKTHNVSLVFSFGPFLLDVDKSTGKFRLDKGTYLITTFFTSIEGFGLSRLTNFEGSTDTSDVFFDINGEPCISTSYTNTGLGVDGMVHSMKTVISIDAPTNFYFQQKDYNGFNREGGHVTVLGTWPNGVSGIGGHIEIERMFDTYIPNEVWTVAGTIITTRETYDRYNRNNNGYVTLTLNNLSNDFTANSGTFNIRVWLNNSFTDLTINTSNNTFSGIVFSGLNGQNYNFIIEDQNYPTSRRLFYTINVPYSSPVTRTYNL